MVLHGSPVESQPFPGLSWLLPAKPTTTVHPSPPQHLPRGQTHHGRVSAARWPEGPEGGPPGL